MLDVAFTGALLLEKLATLPARHVLVTLHGSAFGVIVPVRRERHLLDAQRSLNVTTSSTLPGPVPFCTLSAPQSVSQ
jgi:hypothetical protein|tara:strand:- start:711 stop:941 length:231 start_codon:yes stop_codon:yes gene_type:complete